MIRFGGIKVSDIYYGNKKITEVYFGVNRIYPAEEPTTAITYVIVSVDSATTDGGNWIKVNKDNSGYLVATIQRYVNGKKSGSTFTEILDNLSGDDHFVYSGSDIYFNIVQYGTQLVSQKGYSVSYSYLGDGATEAVTGTTSVLLGVNEITSSSEDYVLAISTTATTYPNTGGTVSYSSSLGKTTTNTWSSGKKSTETETVAEEITFYTKTADTWGEYETATAGDTEDIYIGSNTGDARTVSVMAVYDDAYSSNTLSLSQEHYEPSVWGDMETALTLDDIYAIGDIYDGDMGVYGVAIISTEPFSGDKTYNVTIPLTSSTSTSSYTGTITISSASTISVMNGDGEYITYYGAWVLTPSYMDDYGWDKPDTTDKSQWAFTRKISKYKVITSECIGCYNCDGSCDYDALSFDDDGIASIDQSKCTGCGACAELCTTLAIVPSDD